MLKFFLLAQLGAFILSPNVSQSVSQEQIGGSNEIGTAVITTSMLVTLSADEPLFTIYKADITLLNLKDEASAVKHFGYFNDNLVRCRVDYATKLVYITLRTGDPVAIDWGVEEWNEHFVKKASWWGPGK